MKLVRIYPHNPQRGWFVRTYVDPYLGLKFLADKGWYEVDDNIALELEKAMQKPLDPHSQPVFMIALDEEDAKSQDESVFFKIHSRDDEVGSTDKPIRIKRTRPGTKQLPMEEEEVVDKLKKRRVRGKSRRS